MGWFSKASSWFSDKAQSLGHKERIKMSEGLKEVNGWMVPTNDKMITKKIGQGVRRGYNWGLDHAKDISNIAGKVGDVAGKIQQGATAVGGIISATGVGAPLGALVEGVGGIAGAVSKGAGAVQKGADFVEMGKRKGVFRKVSDDGRRGGINVGKLGDLF